MITKLADVCSITMGQAPTGESYNDRGDGLPLVAGAGDFAGDYLSPTKYTTKPGKISAAGDIVLSIRASIGAKAWADGAYCLGRGVAGLRPGPELDAKFLWFWLGHSERELCAKGRGATFLQVSRKDIGDMTIDLPPPLEQRRIAAILEQAEKITVGRSYGVSLLDSLTRSVFYEMFGDPIRNDQATPTQLLSELGRLDRGVSKHRPRNDPTLLGGPYPLIQTGDVAKCGGYITDYTASYSEVGLTQSRLWPAGTLCITIAANIAKTGILTFEACFPDSVVGFTADPETTIFVQTWLSFLQSTLEATAPQSAQKNINLAVLRNLRIAVPERGALIDFAIRAEKIRAQRDAVRSAVAADSRLFDSLQRRAFRGEL